MAMTRAEKIIKRFETLKNSRMNWDTHWDELAKYIIPKKDNVYGNYNPGAEKHRYLYDSTSIHANELLASALHSMLTNPSLKWFGLSTGDEDLDNMDSVRGWLQECVEIMHSAFNRSNFQTEIHEVYLDLGSFGTAYMQTEEDDEDIVRFHAKPIYDVFIAENNNGVIDTFFTPYKYTGRQLVQEFGNDLPEEVAKCIENKMDDQYDLLYCVFPKSDEFIDKRTKQINKSRRYLSFQLFMKTKEILREGSFAEFPACIPRWSKLSSEIYGRSPGMKALPDIRMLNAMMKTTIRGAQKLVDPPIRVDDDGSHRPVKLIPGGITYTKPGARIDPILSGARIDFGRDIMGEVRNRILQDFFIDQLQLNTGPQMTATEVRQRTEERLRLLSPILGRMHNELLRPLVDRVFAILYRRGMLPEVPQSLAEMGGRLLEVQYVSVIARVQKSSEAQNLLQALGDISPLVQMDPTMMDNIDNDKALRYVLDLRGVPQKIIRDSRQVQDMREQRQQAMQQQQQQAQAMQEAEMVNKVAPAMQE